MFKTAPLSRGGSFGTEFIRAIENDKVLLAAAVLSLLCISRHGTGTLRRDIASRVNRIPRLPWQEFSPRPRGLTRRPRTPEQPRAPRAVTPPKNSVPSVGIEPTARGVQAAGQSLFRAGTEGSNDSKARG